MKRKGAWWTSGWEKFWGVMATCSPKSLIAAMVAHRGGTRGCCVGRHFPECPDAQEGWEPVGCSWGWFSSSLNYHLVSAPLPGASSMLLNVSVCPVGKLSPTSMGCWGLAALSEACLEASSSLCKQFLSALIFLLKILMWRFCSSGCSHSLQRRILINKKN